MGNFQGGGGGRSGGFRGNDRGGNKPGGFQKKSWGGNDRGGDRRGAERAEMHKATCSECSKICEVPFRPSSEKPVYCNDCFGSKREGVDRKPRSDFNDRAPRRELSERAPSRDGQMVRVSPPQNDEVKNQLREMNSKLDRLISALESSTKNKEVKLAPAPKAKPVVVAKEIKKVAKIKVAVKKVIKKKK